MMQKLAHKLHLGQVDVPAEFSLPAHLIQSQDPLAGTVGSVLQQSPAVAAGGSGDDSTAASLPQPLRIDSDDEVSPAPATTVPFIGPAECKLVLGSDGKTYAIEFTRLTCRDANYVPVVATPGINGASSGGTDRIAKSQLDCVDPDIAVAYVLRPELVALWISEQMSQRREAAIAELQTAVAAAAAERKASATPSANAATSGSADSPVSPSGAVADSNEDSSGSAKSTNGAEEDSVLTAIAVEKREEFIKKMEAITPASIGLKMNPNVFLPVTAGSDPTQVAAAEETARMLATFLWDTWLPQVTKSVREGQFTPLDNAQLVSELHRHGINMRYLGRLAALARAEESQDVLRDLEGTLPINKFPTYWRDLIEVEIVARSVKHAVNRLMVSNPAVRAAPAATITSVLNHVFSKANGGADGTQSPSNESGNAPNGNVLVHSTSMDKKKKKKKGSSSSSVSASAGMPPPPPDAAADRQLFLSSVEAEMKRRFLYSFADMRLCLDAISIKTESPAASQEANQAAASPSSKEAVVEAESVSGPMGSRLNRIALLRRVCMLLGLQLAAANTLRGAFDFSQVEPFRQSDVVGMRPVVKSCQVSTFRSRSLSLFL